MSSIQSLGLLPTNGGNIRSNRMLTQRMHLTNARSKINYMLSRILTLILFAPLSLMLVFWLWRVAKKRFHQFSLRGFLILAALIAIGLSAVVGYRRQTMAQTEWLQVGSTRAEKLFPVETICPSENGEFVAADML